MDSIDVKKQKEAVEGWWNSEKSAKWDKKYDDYNAFSMKYLNSRQEKILQFVDELKLEKSSKVLELGFGAGQTALKLVQRGFEVHGVDVSKKFREIANSRCQKAYPGGKFFFKTGSLESKLDYESKKFDLVLVAGVFQYLYDHNRCVEEIYRVLKPGGYFIVAQKNAYCLSHLTSFRKLIRRLIYFLLRENYELFPSFKSMLVDSRLGFFFKKFESNKFFNSKFMLKGHEFWQYKLRKRLIFYTYLKSLVKKKRFIFLKADGVYICFSENPKYMEVNSMFDRFFQKLIDKRFASFMFILAKTIIILSQKKDSPQ